MEQRDKTITEKDKYIKEKEDEIKTLFTDNVQWEEKYSIQSKEIENFKRWSLWDQNLIESFKKIEALEVDLLKANETVEKYQSENEHIKENIEITVTYFINDSKKSGGKYINKTGIVKRIDSVNEYIKFNDNDIVYMKDVININSDELSLFFE